MIDMYTKIYAIKGLKKSPLKIIIIYKMGSIHYGYVTTSTCSEQEMSGSTKLWCRDKKRQFSGRLQHKTVV